MSNEQERWSFTNSFVYPFTLKQTRSAFWIKTFQQLNYHSHCEARRRLKFTYNIQITQILLLEVEHGINFINTITRTGFLFVSIEQPYSNRITNKFWYLNQASKLLLVDELNNSPKTIELFRWSVCIYSKERFKVKSL